MTSRKAQTEDTNPERAPGVRSCCLAAVTGRRTLIAGSAFPSVLLGRLSDQDEISVLDLIEENRSHDEIAFRREGDLAEW